MKHIFILLVFLFVNQSQAQLNNNTIIDYFWTQVTNFNNITLKNPPAFLPGLTEQACTTASFPIMCKEQFGNCVGNCFDQSKFGQLKSNLKCELSLLQWEDIRGYAEVLGGGGQYTGDPPPGQEELISNVLNEFLSYTGTTKNLDYFLNSLDCGTKLLADMGAAYSRSGLPGVTGEILKSAIDKIDARYFDFDQCFNEWEWVLTMGYDRENPGVRKCGRQQYHCKMFVEKFLEFGDYKQDQLYEEDSIFGDTSFKTEIRKTCMKKNLYVKRGGAEDTTLHLFNQNNIQCDLSEADFQNETIRDRDCKIDIRQLKDDEFLEVIPNSVDFPAGLCNEMLNSTFWNFRCQKNNTQDAILVADYFKNGLKCASGI